MVLFIFEKSSVNSKQIAMISALSALGALGRVPFSAIPGVQPTTFIAIASGYAMGPLAGFIVGALSAFISNFFLGQGPWTPWQMLAWGMAGASAGFISKAGIKMKKMSLTFFSVSWGYLFGWIMNLWMWYSYTYPHDIKGYIILCIASGWYDTLHALGNAVFAWMFGGDLVKIISRYKEKMKVGYLQKT